MSQSAHLQQPPQHGLLFFCRRSSRVGRSKEKNSHLFHSSFSPLGADQPVLNDYLRLLLPFGKIAPNSFYHLDRNKLPAQSPKSPNITFALHPFAGSASRCVSLERWITLACKLSARGKVLFVGTPLELAKLRKHLDETSHISKSNFVYADTTCKSLLDVFALIQQVRVFVGHDSGPLHIAAGLGIPVVGVFAPGQPKRTSPQGLKHGEVVYGESPESISSEMLLDAVERALNNQP